MWLNFVQGTRSFGPWWGSVVQVLSALVGDALKTGMDKISKTCT
jgi:hypothetical protein